MVKYLRGMAVGLSGLAILFLSACGNQGVPRLPKEEREKLSYAFGVQIANGWQNAKIDFEVDPAIRGMGDGWAGDFRVMNSDAAQKVLVDYRPGQPPAPAADARFKSAREMASYAYGLNTGAAWRILKADLDIPSLRAGIVDFQAQKNRISVDDARTITDQFGEQIVEKARAERQQIAEKNKREGDLFLKENQKRTGVMTLPSGLQYKVLASGGGQGKSPELEDFVRLSYQGALLDGTVVDDCSDTPDKTRVMPMRAIISGWQEALQMMRPGDKWQLFIPPDQAYAEAGGYKVGPNATLIYTVELREIVRPPRAKDEPLSGPND